VGPARAILEAGADDLLPKPFTAADLMGRMRLILARPA
jgi:DNA-binding response OmpR family regulator